MNLLESLTWRYATKKFSPRKVAAEEVNAIVEAIALSASSAGLQPYRLFVIENPALRQHLQPHSFNQQVAACSHLLVFAGLKTLTLAHIERYLAQVAAQRNMPIAALNGYKAALTNGLLSRSEEVNFHWATNQAYIGLGTALIAAAQLRVDATPMEGFDAAQFDALLHLQEKGLRSVVLLALGYRDEAQDPYASVTKVRLPRQEFVTEL